MSHHDSEWDPAWDLVDTRVFYEVRDHIHYGQTMPLSGHMARIVWDEVREVIETTYHITIYNPIRSDVYERVYRHQISRVLDPVVNDVKITILRDTLDNP